VSAAVAGSIDECRKPAVRVSSRIDGASGLVVDAATDAAAAVDGTVVDELVVDELVVDEIVVGELVVGGIVVSARALE
jgi:hypothetical protein